MLHCSIMSHSVGEEFLQTRRCGTLMGIPPRHVIFEQMSDRQTTADRT